MPRSFLVKKAKKSEDDRTSYIKLKELYSETAAVAESFKAVTPYTPLIPQLTLQLSHAYANDILQLPTPPSSRDGSESCLEGLLKLDMPRVARDAGDSGQADAMSDMQTARQFGITVGYTYEAFMVSDGRSRKRKLGMPGLIDPIAAIPELSKSRYTCTECGKHYATSSNLSRHKQTHRSLDSQLAKSCPHCHKVYVSMPALSMHMLTHELKHTCGICGKAFSRPWLLQGHARSHTGERPYGCAHCGKAFADRSNLRAHMQTHSALKHYQCQRCHKTFALKSYLNKHYESACIKE